MTTPTETIDLSDVNVELGNASNAIISLDDNPVRMMASIPSGQIGMSNLREKNAFGNEAIFTAGTSQNWVVPPGVTSISAVCIGGGGGGLATTSGGSGGGGGDLRYYNNLSVTPGETLTVTIGGKGLRGSSPTAGGVSSISRGATVLLQAAGGGAGTLSGILTKNGTSSTIGGSIGGGNGGITSVPSSSTCTGGGGAGGYSGSGGNGSTISISAGSGLGGGGGGGSGGGGDDQAGPGGGVNLFGQDLSGSAGGFQSAINGNSGEGGSFGDGAVNSTGFASSGSRSDDLNNSFGGGGGGADNTSEGTDGGQGAVRIVWPGTTRQFPSTDVGMSQVFPLTFDNQSSTSGSITIPGAALQTDLAVLMNTHLSTGAQSDPSGWARIISVDGTQGGGTPVVVVSMWYRTLQFGDAGTNVTMTGGTLPSSQIIVFRRNSLFSSYSVSSVDYYWNFGPDPMTQNINITTIPAPFIVVSTLGVFITTYGTSFLEFYGGSSGSTSAIEPSVTFPENGDTSRSGFMRYKIYDKTPSTPLVVESTPSTFTRTLVTAVIRLG